MSPIASLDPFHENAGPEGLFRVHEDSGEQFMEKPKQYGVLMTTVGNKDDALTIAKALLAEKLAACVQLMPIESCYTWKGAVANDSEILLLIKTKTALFDEAIGAVKNLHPYETPEIVATAFTAGFANYFAWIDDVTK